VEKQEKCKTSLLNGTKLAVAVYFSNFSNAIFEHVEPVSTRSAR
jgi:hypothetical protein